MKVYDFTRKYVITFLLIVITLNFFSKQVSAAQLTFEDVPTDAWYYDEVMEVVDLGLFKGTSDTCFSPNDSLVRGMFVTVMWRYEGEPGGYTHSFEDVYETDYYHNSIAWANNKGMVYGINDKSFAPNQALSREQMATMMYRYAQYLGFTIEMEGYDSLDAYTDGNTVSAYAVDAVKWAMGNNFLVAEAGKIRPLDVATRAEAAVVWARFVKEYSENTDESESKAGKSAYELAVDNGYEGTVQEWLQSLVGESGDSAYELAVKNGYENSEVEWLRSLAGKDGLSAYEIAVKYGYVGTEEEWLRSLVGQDGKSAYELAVDNGFEGTLEEWLISLVGTAGVDGLTGKSAYELAVDAGFEGTLDQWLDSLVGRDGLSAYEIAIENGFVGSKEEWLDSLKGEHGKSAYDVAVEAGFEGTEEEWLNSLNGKDGIGIENAYIDENSHLILEMTNGETIDAGFVGKMDDTVISTAYTVTFTDYNGNVLSAQQVEKGGNATPPTAPNREGYTFTGWDKSYLNVTSDLTITAQYEKNSTDTYTVTFTDYDGTVLATQEVSAGLSASLPVNPIKSGTTFIGWTGNYVDVTQNETVRAVYSDEKNVFVVASSSGSVGDTVTVLVAVDGSVKTCGFDFDLFYDSALELISYDNDLDLDVIINDSLYTNGIKLNFSSASDKTKQRDIIELTFKINDTAKSALPIVIEMTEVFEVTSSGTIENIPYVVVDGVVTVE